MALVKAARGVLLLLKVGNGASPEVFTALCTVNAARSIKGTAQINNVNIPDCTDPDLLAWVTGEKASLQYTVSGAGMLNTPDVMAMTTWLASPDPKNCQIVMDIPAADGGVTFSGAFDLTDFEITGDRGAKMECTLSLASNGAVAIAENAA